MSGDQGESPSVTLRRAAMDCLARREHSFQELRDKLSEKFPDVERDDVLIPVLDRLREEGLQSDERFVESYVRSRRNRGHGPLKIEMELRHKGVVASLVSEFINTAGNDWKALAAQALHKKFPRLDLASPKEKQRYYRFLQQRGFRAEDIGASLHPDTDN